MIKKKIKKLLIANRGEIACKIIKCAKNLDIPTVAIYSNEDADSLHTQLADEAVNIPGSSVSETYMNGPSIISLCKKYKANAIHPGYGLLSENAKFVKIIEKNKLIFIGPKSTIIKNMGEKDKAKLIMEEAGVPVIPGYHGDNQDKDFLRKKADEIGYPVLIKARSGGGGRGMRVVQNKENFFSALEDASSEASTNFNDKNILIEKYITKARHIEVQIFSDHQGNVVHLFDRDCTLQRRQQKIIEEAPSPKLSEDIRKFLGDLAVNALKSLDYQGAGTIEFIADITDGLNKNKIYFMEMNTRIQVEHPVTEKITSTNLIEWQLHISNGLTLPKSQNEIYLNGWSLEARLYAEDINKNFLPQSGCLHHLKFPKNSDHPYCIIDTGNKKGDFISPYYDPMIAKIISHGKNRKEAINHLRNCLFDIEVAGITTNLNLLKKLLKNNYFREGDIYTKFIENNIEQFMDKDVEPQLKALASLIIFNNLTPSQKNYWYNWKPTTYPINITIGQKVTSFFITKTSNKNFEVAFNNKDFYFSSVSFHDSTLKAKTKNKYFELKFYVFKDKSTGNKNFTIFSDENTFDAVFKNSLTQDSVEQSKFEDSVFAPMHGIIKINNLKIKNRVKKGDVLLKLEAMKMEYSLIAPRDGIIKEIFCKNGEQVIENSKLLNLEKIK